MALCALVEGKLEARSLIARRHAFTNAIVLLRNKLPLHILRRPCLHKDIVHADHAGELGANGAHARLEGPINLDTEDIAQAKGFAAGVCDLPGVGFEAISMMRYDVRWRVSCSRV